MRVVWLLLIVLFLAGCATYDVHQMRQNQNANLSDVFVKSKQEVYDAVKTSISRTDLVIRQEDFAKGEILATPNRFHSFGKRLIMNTSYIGVYFYINSQDSGATKLEIVQVYDNPMNVGREYKTGLLQGVREILTRNSNAQNY